MARSEKAKELEAKQKAEARAEKERRKNSDDPRDWGQMRQLRETYKMASQIDPQLKWWLVGPLVGGVVLGIVLGILLRPTVLWVLIGIMLGITLSMMFFLRRIKGATYKKFEGQPGSAEVALGMLDKKKWVINPAINATRDMDVVHRALGPAGLLLIGEGDPNRVRKLLTTEVKRHEQVAYGVKAKTIVMGKREGEVPLDRLADHIKKMPKTMDAAQVAEVRKRLTAIDAMRKRLPVPQGPVNVRGARQAMRGR